MWLNVSHRTSAVTTKHTAVPRMPNVRMLPMWLKNSCGEVEGGQVGRGLQFLRDFTCCCEGKEALGFASTFVVRGGGLKRSMSAAQRNYNARVGSEVEASKISWLGLKPPSKKKKDECLCQPGVCVHSEKVPYLASWQGSH
eukprot:307429-Pelagomonas_calceolata.AAC.5